VARSRPYLHQSPPRLKGSGAYPVRDESGEPLIRLQTLGAATVLVGEARLSAAAGTLFSLLIRVAHTPGMLLGRDVLLRSLWPDQDEVRQRANLRQALYKLRSYGVRIGLIGDVVQLDVSQVLRTFSVERIAPTFERDVTLGHEPFGPFLAGFSVPWPEYQEWIATEREAVHAEVRRVLAGELRRRRERADWGGADALARWLLQFDPLNEEATLTIAECMALSGSKSEALATIDRYLSELGPNAGDIRLPATMLRRRIAEPHKQGHLSFAATERHFIGREREMADMTLRMRRARWHDGSGTLLHGAPGIGKSRLANELEKVAVLEGIRVTTYACRESDMVRPLAVFADLLPEIMTYAGALGCDPASYEALRRLVPTDQRDALFPVSAPVAPPTPVSSPVSSPEGSPEGSPEVPSEAAAAQEAERASVPVPEPPPVLRPPMPMMSTMRRALLDLLGAVSDERPMFLVIDDVHWIDEHSWDVLSDLIDRAHTMRVCVLVLSREPHARAQAPQRSSMALHIEELAPLSADSCILLARAIGDDLSASVSDELGAWFTGASEGNPLFLRALVNHWIETGEAGGVPPTLRGVIEQRLSQLSGDAMRVLQTAALLGRWATTERVMSVLELSIISMLQAIEDLARIGAVKCEGLGNLIVPDLKLQTVMESIPTVVRSMLNLRIADSLRTAYESSLLPCETKVLEHYVAAGAVENAIQFFETAATLLLSCDAAHRALALTRVAIEQIPNFRNRNSLATIHRDVLFSAGQYSRLLSDHDWSNAVTSSSSTWDRRYANEVVRIIEISDRGMFLGDFQELCCRGLLVALDEEVEASIRFRACIAVLRACANGVPREIAESAYSTSKRIVNRLKDPTIASCEIDLYFHTTFGNLVQSTVAANFLGSETTSFGSVSDRARLLGDSGYALMCGGDLTRAKELLSKAQEVAIKNAMHSRVVALGYHLSHIALLEGRVGDALALGNECLENAIGADDPFLEGLSRRNIVRICLLTDDTLSAQHEYAKVASAKSVASHPKWRAFDIAIQLGIAVSQSDEQKVFALLPEAEEHLGSLGGLMGQDFLATQVVRAQSITDRKKAKATLSRYTANQRREAYPIPGFLRVPEK
jgi:DNA-binding SARP family transcriptional activator